MSAPHVELWRELSVWPHARVPSLVGCTVEGSVISAEVADLEHTDQVTVVDDDLGSLTQHRIRLEHSRVDGGWSLVLPAGDERAGVRWEGGPEEVPADAVAALVAVHESALRRHGVAPHVRQVIHVLGDDGRELAHLVRDTAPSARAALPATTRHRLEVVAGEATVRAHLVELLESSGFDADAAGEEAPPDPVASGWLAAARGLRAADPALRLDVAGAAAWQRAAGRAALAALAVRRQVGDVETARLRSEIDRLDGVVAALDEVDALAQPLASVVAADRWEDALLAERRRPALEALGAELDSASYRRMLADLAEPPQLAEPPPDVLADLADRSVRRVERRLAEAGRALTDHDLLWVVGGARRAVARARFPGLLGSDGRRKRARRIGTILVLVDERLAELAGVVRAKAAAGDLARAAGAPDGWREGRRRLAERQAELGHELPELGARLRRRRKK